MSKNQRKPLTLDDHKRIGQMLFSINRQLISLEIEVSDRCGKTSFALKSAHRMNRQLLLLRSELDNEVCGIPGGGPEIYYRQDQQVKP